MEEAGVDPPVVEGVRRIFLDGIPAKVNASSAEENFLAYYRYGNHSTVDEVPEKTYKALVKDSRKGFTLVLDERVALFMLHCHLTPQGIVDLNTPHKNPRPIFDSSFRPDPWSFSINDWTSKDNEPELTFPGAEMGFMVWLYNLRISYPDEEVCVADDDVSGAFRLMKYHPNCVPLHTSRQCGYCVVNTGGTFGDNTSPSNFDPLGLARRQLAQSLWQKSTEASDWAAEYLPSSVRTAAAPTADEVSSFRRADPDSKNPGVIGSDGRRKSPPHNMHVDDALYADVLRFLRHTILVSVASLFLLLGIPNNPMVPSPLSDDKFEAFYNHERRLVGRRFNSRTLSVGMLDYKREQLVALLQEWLSMPDFGLLDIAHPLGTLENHTRYAVWARCWYFALQNAARRILRTRYHAVKRKFDKKRKTIWCRNRLPQKIQHRVSTLVSRDQAHFLWATKQRSKVTDEVADSVSNLLHFLTVTEDPWEVPLGLIVPRVPHFWSRGDASKKGGGAYCPGLGFWFDLTWSDRVVKGVRDLSLSPKAADYVHINSLEFIVVVLQLAAIKVRLESLTESQAATYFPSGLPDIPVWFGETDNSVSKSWANRATSGSSQGQGLVTVYSELLRTTVVNVECEHVAGKLNIVADDISRNDFSLPLSSRTIQLFRKHSSLESLDYFLPSQEFLQLLTSRLFSKRTPGPCALPRHLGHFVPAGSTTSILPMA